MYYDGRISYDHCASSKLDVVIIGAGPAGLTCAYELMKGGLRAVIVEKDTMVGGLSRTDEYKGYLFDIGGHRFYTKLSMVEDMWREVLGDDLLTRPRLSRIYYKTRFFQYPIQPWDALTKLGLAETIRCGISYAQAKISPVLPETSFEDWVSNRFGKRLFRIFFKTYTEKVWGIPCTELRADWAAQRIRGLSVPTILKHTLRNLIGSGFGSGTPKTLISKFLYPRLGPGMMWQRTASILDDFGSPVHFGSDVTRILWEPGRITGIEAGGRVFSARQYVSSMPVREFLERMDPAPPEKLRRAATCFKYRDFITVILIVRGAKSFPDNWIYIHDQEFKVGRIQNFRQWSPDMVPDADTTSLGLEYFCHEGDSLWNMSDPELLALAKKEVVSLGLVEKAAVLDGTVRRVPKAYPVYDREYKTGLQAVREFLSGMDNLQFIGRNGMHHYNNQDHSMLTGILAARNILGAKFDLWAVNANSEYLEGEGSGVDLDMITELAKTQPPVPRSLSDS